MDSIVHAALEQICCGGATGVPLPSLWPKLHSSLSLHGLPPLCPAVKQSLWSNLLQIPALRFEARGGGASFVSTDPRIRTAEDCETLGLRIVADDNLRETFVGIYDIKASDAAISREQRRVLDRLAIARSFADSLFLGLILFNVIYFFRFVCFLRLF